MAIQPPPVPSQPNRAFSQPSPQPKPLPAPQPGQPAAQGQAAGQPPVEPLAPAPGFWQHPFLQSVMGFPFISSLLLHIGLIGLGFLTFEAAKKIRAAATVEPIVVPDATMPEDGGPIGGIPHPGVGGDPNRDAAQNIDPTVTQPGGLFEKKGDTLNAQLMGGGSGEGEGSSQLIGIGGPGIGKGGGTGTGIGTGVGTGTGDGTGPLAIFGPPGGGGGIGPKSTFLGTGGNARLICYVCDATGSMMQRFDDLRGEIRKSVGSLRGTQAFNVIFFQDTGAAAADSSKLLFANPENKDKTFKFMDSTVARGQTNPIPGLELAFKLKPQLIYLLTDGDFPDNDAVLKWIRERNADKKIKINTIAFVNRGEGYEKVLQTIANENNGQFRFVSEDELGK